MRPDDRGHGKALSRHEVVGEASEGAGFVPAKFPHQAGYFSGNAKPKYFRFCERVQAHIFVAALAFLLHRAIEKKLKTARLDLSATEALTALKSVRVVDIDLGDGTTKRSVTRGTQRAAAVLRALGITDLDPPIPPQPGQTIV